MTYTARNPHSDLQAVAAMPGLEEIAQPMEGHLPLRTQTDPASLMILLAARWAFKSMNVADSMFATTPLWRDLRDSAARVGRHLPKDPPTFDQLRHHRDRGGAVMCNSVADAFAAPAMRLAQQAGFFDPAAHKDPNHPTRTSHIYGDGTVFSALSNVKVGDDGLVYGSRAEVTPRVAERFYGKDEGDGGNGVPIALVGTHGDGRWNRFVLGLSHYADRDEIGASMALFDQVIALGQGGVHSVNYDKLMSGRRQRELMMQGVIPIVAMPQATEKASHLVIPEEMRRDRSARRRAIGQSPKIKTRAQLVHFGTVSHCNGRCTHDLWLLDGALVAVAAGRVPTFASPLAERMTLSFQEGTKNALQLIGCYRIECGYGSFTHSFDLSGRRKTSPNGKPLALADHVRAFPERDPLYKELAGRRNDVESTFSWLDRSLPLDGRATSLNPVNFLLDVVGGGVLCNARAWDVHISQHTACGQINAKEIAGQRQRAAQREAGGLGRAQR